MRIQRLTDIPDFPLPLSSTEFAGAYDLHAAIRLPILIDPGDQAMVPTGYAWEIPVGKVGLLLPRSGKGTREGAVLGNLVGLIDPDYRGEVKASIWNRNLPDVNADEKGSLHAALQMPLVIDPYVNGRRLPKYAQVRMCGNSVPPVWPRALVAANFVHEEKFQVAA